MFIKQFLQVMSLLKHMRVTPEELYTKNILPREPFYRGPDAHKFFEAIKTNDSNTVITMIMKDRFIIFEHDAVGETALHWAAKRNRPDMVKILIDNGAIIDARDMGGRSPLYLASKFNHL